MKKKAKKLVLAKETVRTLMVSQVRGGEYMTYTCQVMETCACSASCEWTCQCVSNRVACWEQHNTREC